MRTAGELEATLDGDTWVVRLVELEESSGYLDYALSRLLDVQGREVHLLAARLVEALLVEAQRGGHRAGETSAV